MQVKIEIITIVILFLGTMFFAWLPHAIKGIGSKYKIFESFACGIFFAAALLIFIPDIINQTTNFSKSMQSRYIVSSFIIMGSTFLVFLFLEHLVGKQRSSKNLNKSSSVKTKSKIKYIRIEKNNILKQKSYFHHIKKNHHPKLEAPINSFNKSLLIGLDNGFNRKQNAKMMFVFFLILVVHSYLAGFGISIYFQQKQNQITFFILIICGILIHKFTISFTLSVYLKKHNFTKYKICLLMFIFSIMTPLGLLSTHIFNLSNTANWIVTCIAGGVFLFLGTLHGLYNSVLIKRCCNFNYFLFVIFGFVITAIPAFLLNTM